MSKREKKILKQVKDLQSEISELKDMVWDLQVSNKQITNELNETLRIIKEPITDEK